MRKNATLALAALLFAVFTSCNTQTNSSSPADKGRDTTQTGSTTSSGTTEQELIKITQELNDADLRGDKKVFDKYFADNYFSTSGDGVITTREQVLTRMTPRNAADYLSTNLEDIQVQESGNTAVLSVRYVDQHKTTGTIRTRKFRATDTFVKQNGQWKLMTRHISVIPADKTPVKINPDLYNTYIGEYERTPTPNLIITRDGNKLMWQVAGSSEKNELLPKNETTFFEKGHRRETTFIKNNQGLTTHAILKYADGQELKIKKIK